MRWVLMTAFGVPVEPEVNRNFAIVSGVIAAKALATSGVSGVIAIFWNGIASESPASPLTIVAECSGAIAASAAPNGLAPETKIAAGAVGEEKPLWCVLRPMLQPVADAARAFL